MRVLAVDLRVPLQWKLWASNKTRQFLSELKISNSTSGLVLIKFCMKVEVGNNEFVRVNSHLRTRESDIANNE